MNELALFAGAGGGILGSHLLGWRTVAAVEIEEYPRAVLLQRQLDGVLPRFPIWDDIKTFDGKPWRGKVDVITGGFPCQDISAAGKGKGLKGERSGLWSEMARIISEVQPSYCLVENSPMLTFRGLDRVLYDLAKMGYDARWGIIGAHHIGAPHKRDRIWIVANARDNSGGNSKHASIGRNGTRELEATKRTLETITLTGSGKTSQTLSNANEEGLEGQPWDVIDRDKPRRQQEEQNRPISQSGLSWWDTDPADLPNANRYGLGDKNRNAPEQGGHKQKNGLPKRDDHRPTESRLGRVANGVANRVDRLKAIGNGQVPGVAKLAWETLIERAKRGKI